MKIKHKLTLWVGLLFILIILQAVMAIVQLQSVAVASENILEANYNSLVYARDMLHSLDQMGTQPDARQQFEKQLILQENNITEPGEDDWTLQLRTHFNLLQKISFGFA